MIGERTAEELKINAGTAFPREDQLKVEVRGRNLISGLPKTIEVTSDEMLEVSSRYPLLPMQCIRYWKEHSGAFCRYQRQGHCYGRGGSH